MNNSVDQFENVSMLLTVDKIQLVAIHSDKACVFHSIVVHVLYKDNIEFIEGEIVVEVLFEKL